MITQPQYFKISEFVCEHVWDVYAQNAWMFFDTKLLVTMENIRDRIGKPILINNWQQKTSFYDRANSFVKVLIGYLLLRFALFDVIWNISAGMDNIFFYGTTKLYDKILNKFLSWTGMAGFVIIIATKAIAAFLGIIFLL